MEKINRHNYAIFFVDYFDNELTEQTTKDLFAFLELNPDLKEEFESFENISLPIQSIELENKIELKKHINESNIEHYIIAELEGELDKNDKQEYTSFIAENMLYVSTVKRYKRTILPIETIVFPNKSSIKKKQKLIVFWPYITAIAAVILLFFILNTKNKTQQYQLQALKETQKLDSNEVLNNDYFIELQAKSEKLIKPIIATNTEIIKASTNKGLNKNVSPVLHTTDTLKKLPNAEVEFFPFEKEIAIHLENIENEEVDNNIALAENKTILLESNTIQKVAIPTLKQTIHNTIKSKVFNDDKNNNQPIDKVYLITSAAEKSKNIIFEQTEKKERKKTRLRIGKFEFYSDKGV